jgi:hypothetical protein
VVAEKARVEGIKVLQRPLELPFPAVGVANGPAIIQILLLEGESFRFRQSLGEQAQAPAVP